MPKLDPHARQPASDVPAFKLSFRPPYDWDALMSFLGARAIGGVEAIEHSAYRRIARLFHNGQWQMGWIEVTPHTSKTAMRVSVSASLEKVLSTVLERIAHLLDLSCNPPR